MRVEGCVQVLPAGSAEGGEKEEDNCEKNCCEESICKTESKRGLSYFPRPFSHLSDCFTASSSSLYRRSFHPHQSISINSTAQVVCKHIQLAFVIRIGSIEINCLGFSCSMSDEAFEIELIFVLTFDRKLSGILFLSSACLLPAEGYRREGFWHNLEISGRRQ